jgi:hypothetical protein
MILIPALGYGTISLCVLEDDAPDTTNVILSFDELYLAEGSTVETVAQRHQSARSSTDDEYSLRLEGHRNNYKLEFEFDSDRVKGNYIHL